MHAISRFLWRPVAAALVVAMAGCGSDTKGAATATTTTPSGADGFATYRQCLADNGVTLPDRRQGGSPSADGQDPSGPTGRDPQGPPPDGRQGGGGFGGLDPSDPNVAKALAACQDKRPIGGPGGSAGRGGPLSQATKDCLAGKGITVTEGQQLDRTDPAVRAALQACRPNTGSGSSTTASTVAPAG